MNNSDYSALFSKIRQLLSEKDGVILAIDGRCASGKTTLAGKLQDEFCCNVIHVDDFYLPMNEREENWQKNPAKNIDFARLESVIKNTPHRETYQVAPYVCSEGKFGEPIIYHKNRLTIIEGSYSCHPKLKKYYHYCVFMDILPEFQKERLLKRNGDTGYLRFKNLWIPLEEQYFKKHSVLEQCDMVISNE